MHMAFCLPVLIFIGIAFDINTVSSFQSTKYLEYFLLHIWKLWNTHKTLPGKHE